MYSRGEIVLFATIILPDKSAGKEVMKMDVLIHIAAKELGLSPRTLDRWARAGRIKFNRSAGGWRLFDSAEIARVKSLLAGKRRWGGHI